MSIINSVTDHFGSDRYEEDRNPLSTTVYNESDSTVNSVSESELVGFDHVFAKSMRLGDGAGTLTINTDNAARDVAERVYVGHVESYGDDFVALSVDNGKYHAVISRSSIIAIRSKTDLDD